MYTPKYYITNKVLHFVVKFEMARQSINRIPLPMKERKKLLLSTQSENLYYMSKITGIDVSLKEAEKIITGKEINVLKMPQILLVNYRNACEFINQMKRDRYISFSPGTILHLNKLLTNTWIESWNSGRFRNNQEAPNVQYDRWTTYRDNDKNLVNVQNYLSEVVDWVKETRFLVHPLIKTAVMIYELFNLAPFFASNQMTILSIIELLYSEFNLSKNKFLTVSRNIYTYEDEYIETMMAARESGDLTSWIEKYVRGVSLDTNNIKDQLYQIEKEKIKQKRELLLGLNSRQLQGFNYIKKHHKITRREYTKITGVSFMTAYRDLNELEKRSLIFKYGYGRSTYYTSIDQNQKNDSGKNVSIYSNVGQLDDLKKIEY